MSLRVIPNDLIAVDAEEFQTGVAIALPLIPHPCVILKFVNATSSAVVVSWDGGINTHDAIPANSFSLYDFSANAGKDRGLYVAKNTPFAVTGSEGATGTFAIVSFTTSEYVNT